MSFFPSLLILCYAPRHLLWRTRAKILNTNFNCRNHRRFCTKTKSVWNFSALIIVRTSLDNSLNIRLRLRSKLWGADKLIRHWSIQQCHIQPQQILFYQTAHYFSHRLNKGDGIEKNYWPTDSPTPKDEVFNIPCLSFLWN